MQIVDVEEDRVGEWQSKKEVNIEIGFRNMHLKFDHTFSI